VTAPADSRARRPGERSRPAWNTWVPLGLVVASLLALAVLPDTVARRMERVRRDVAQRVTPARNELRAFGLGIAREVLALRAWLLTGNPEFADEFRRSAADADRSLEAAARYLSGTDLAPLAAELRSRLEGWREAARRALEGRVSGVEDLADMAGQQRRVDEVLELSSLLDKRLAGWEEAATARMQAESRRQALFSAFLAAVALAGTAAVGLLGVQSRRLARQLRYRAQEERALRDVARTLSAAVTVAEVAQRVVQAAIDTTRGFGAYVEEVRGDHVEVVAVAGSGVAPVGTRAPFPGSLTEAILKTGEATLVAEVGAIGESMATYLEGKCQGCTGLVVPLLAGTDVLGALVVLRSSDQPPFGPDEIRHAQALGDLVSAALRRVGLLERTAESEAQFRALAENAAAAILVMKQDHTIVFANPATHRVFGYGPDELLGRPLTDLMPPDLRESHRRGVRRFLSTGKRHLRWEGVELVGLRKDGVVVPLEITMGTFVRDGVPYFVGIAQDITARKQAETERLELLERERSARERAEAAVRTREEVLAIVSHDLRNPLNTIALAVSALESGDMPPQEAARTIEVVRRAVDRMTRLIADLLDVARVAAGQKLTIQPERLDIRSVVAETCDGLAAEAERKRQHLECRVGDDLPPVEGDRHRLVQVLSNLVGNALKFTGEDGRVTVTAEREGTDVVVSVTDTGPGIRPEHLAQVFNPYWQARQTARLGSGLGLAIAKGIVEAHGGRIWATSTPGSGSTFAFALGALDAKQADTAAKDATARS
jgi:PAS domain S-box-containing protein